MKIERRREGYHQHFLKELSLKQKSINYSSSGKNINLLQASALQAFQYVCNCIICSSLNGKLYTFFFLAIIISSWHWNVINQMESDFIASTQNFLLRCVKIKFRSHKLHANDRSSRICLLISKYRSKKKLSTYHSQHRVEIFRFDPFFSLFCLTRFDLLIVDEFKFFCDVSFFSARSSK